MFWYKKDTYEDIPEIIVTNLSLQNKNKTALAILDITKGIAPSSITSGKSKSEII